MVAERDDRRIEHHRRQLCTLDEAQPSERHQEDVKEKFLVAEVVPEGGEGRPREGAEDAISRRQLGDFDVIVPIIVEDRGNGALNLDEERGGHERDDRDRRHDEPARQRQLAR